MVEGLTTSAPDPGSGTGMNRDGIPNNTRDRGSRLLGARARRSIARTQPITSSSRILVTLAERPYPFPSRTRKSSSPAPKILRGQPFGKIGRRQDLVLSGPVRRARRLATVTNDSSGYAAADDHGRSGHTACRGGPTARRTIAPSRWLSVPPVRGRWLATRRALARPPLRRIQPGSPARSRETGAAV